MLRVWRGCVVGKEYVAGAHAHFCPHTPVWRWEVAWECEEEVIKEVS